MHAFDDGVGGDDEVAGGRFQDRGIVGQIEGAGIGGERTEIARDQGVFTGGHGDLSSRSRHTLLRHPEEPRSCAASRRIATCAGARGPSFEARREERRAPQDDGVARENSSPRNWRAIWSSTALTMPVSSPSTKACATSTYSDTTTRAGTSLRCSSS